LINFKKIKQITYTQFHSIFVYYIYVKVKIFIGDALLDFKNISFKYPNKYIGYIPLNPHDITDVIDLCNVYILYLND